MPRDESTTRLRSTTVSSSALPREDRRPGGPAPGHRAADSVEAVVADGPGSRAENVDAIGVVGWCIGGVRELGAGDDPVGRHGAIVGEAALEQLLARVLELRVVQYEPRRRAFAAHLDRVVAEPIGS